MFYNSLQTSTAQISQAQPAAAATQQTAAAAENFVSDSVPTTLFHNATSVNAGNPNGAQAYPNPIPPAPRPPTPPAGYRPAAPRAAPPGSAGFGSRPAGPRPAGPRPAGPRPAGPRPAAPGAYSEREEVAEQLASLRKRYQEELKNLYPDPEQYHRVLDAEEQEVFGHRPPPRPVRRPPPPPRRIDPYLRDPYADDPYLRDPYAEDPYLNDPYADDPYLEPYADPYAGRSLQPRPQFEYEEFDGYYPGRGRGRGRGGGGRGRGVGMGGRGGAQGRGRGRERGGGNIGRGRGGTPRGRGRGRGGGGQQKQQIKKEVKQEKKEDDDDVVKIPCPADGCEREYRNDQALFHHFREAHMELMWKFTCALCDTLSKRMLGIRRHYVQHHNLESDDILPWQNYVFVSNRKVRNAQYSDPKCPPPSGYKEWDNRMVSRFPKKHEMDHNIPFRLEKIRGVRLSGIPGTGDTRTKEYQKLEDEKHFLAKEAGLQPMEKPEPGTELAKKTEELETQQAALLYDDTSFYME